MDTGGKQQQHLWPQMTQMDTDENQRLQRYGQQLQIFGHRWTQMSAKEGQGELQIPLCVVDGPNYTDRKENAGHYARRALLAKTNMSSLAGRGQRENPLLLTADKKEGSFAVGFGDGLRTAALRMTWRLFYGWSG
jgi:hypothetical protein